MRPGRIVGAVTGEHMNENEVVVLATGVKFGEAAQRSKND
jgi:ribose transport system ATP-binding protein